MPQVPFDALPGSARLWGFQASRPLGAEERETLLGATDRFLTSWTAHGAPLTAARDWRHDRFLFVAVDEEAAGVSGCSIDALVRTFRGLEDDLQVTLTDNGPIWFRLGGQLRRVSRAEFGDLAARQEIDPDVIVFDNTLTTVGQLREGRWEVPAREAWHGRAFFRAARRHG